MRTVDAVVVGGGCIGTSVLYHLASLGCTNTLLLETGSLGSGSTSKAAGGIRMQHQDELNTRMALRSLHEFESFAELTGTEIDFKQVGYLFVFADPAEQAAFAEAAVFQRQLGIPTEMLTADDARARVPGMRTDDLVGASFCPFEGFAAPEAVVQGFAGAARRLGARIEVNTPVVEIVVDGDQVTGVRTPNEGIATPVVVVAAGVGSGELTRPLGVDVPVTGVPRTIFFSSSSAGVPCGSPLVVDFATGFYFHREGPGLVFAGRESDPGELSIPAVHRLPAIDDVAIKTSWWGNYDTSPDHNALIGSASVLGLHYATGFSGHGFMQSPAVGEHVAELVLGRTPTLDLASLNADRFAAGRTRAESFVI